MAKREKSAKKRESAADEKRPRFAVPEDRAKDLEAPKDKTKDVKGGRIDFKV